MRIDNAIVTSHKVRVWDLPTRLFHWTLVALIAAQLVTASIGGNLMDLHFRSGYAIFTLLLWRIVWGFVGGRWSRFASFVYGPSAVLVYLRGKAPSAHSVGHSPLGAGSVFALLALLSAQVASGLFSDDDIAYSGPLARLVSNDWVSDATNWHTAWGKYILLALIALHIAAIAYYRWRKKQHLTEPMIVGDKQLVQAALPSRDDAASRLAALVVLLVCAGLVWWVVNR
ncbi:MAG: cytochrome b/b6 domain-containing protein [Burkholderiaceae bacterium]